MSCYSELMSHPNKKLETHLLNVAKSSETIFESLCIEDSFLYAKISFLIGIAHDFAKSTSFFQDYLFSDVKSERHVKSERARHGFLSAVFAYYIVKDFLDKNDFDSDINFSAIAFIVVFRHHGNLSSLLGNSGVVNKIDLNKKVAITQINDIHNRLNDDDLTLKQFYKDYNISLVDFCNCYSEIVEELSVLIEDLSFEEDLNNYIYSILFYSVLIDSDKMDASGTEFIERFEFDCNMVDKFKSKEFGSVVDGINIIREDAYNEVISNISNMDLNNHVLSIDLPTGAGKTLTAFSAALKLRSKIRNELEFEPRIIYSLPFLSIIDQNEKVLSDVLDCVGLKGHNILLKHNYLSDMSYKTDDEFNYDINKSRILIEGWNSEIIITTFVQFFYSLIGNKNRSLRKFHNMTNSIILLDEIQAIPYHYWNIVNTLLKKLSYKFNTWVILITATQPLIFNEDKEEINEYKKEINEDKKEIVPLVKDRNYYYGEFDRVDYNFNLEDIGLDIFKHIFIEEIDNNPSKNIMAVLNTINSSKQLYDYVSDYFEEYEDVEIDECNGVVYINDDTQLIYLSTNIIPKHRLSKIKQINDSNRRSIIITTQLIEAGVDISVDIIYRDLAPLDSIIQTAGRCNRNSSDSKGIVNVVSLVNENNKRFSGFVYNSILISATKDILNNIKHVSEREFNVNASLDYYKNVLTYGSTEKSKKLIQILERLDFEDIPREFKLIDSDIEKIDVFVEVDDYSMELWKKFRRIKDIKNPFERKDAFLSIKSDFYNYIVSINEKHLGATLIDRWVGYISRDDLDMKYDIETGFKPQNEEDVFIS